MTGGHAALLAVALPCLDASGARVDAIREVLAGVDDLSLQEADLALQWDDERLQLHDLRRRASRPLEVDWLEPLLRQRSWPASRQGPLAQALGRRTESVIDATAGWGQDALRMLMMGYRVQLIERCQVIGALLIDGVRRCFEAELPHADALAPPIVVADACTVLQTMSADCIYLDPIFPPKRNPSALAKRPLHLLRELVGDDADRDALFDAATRAARRRVVVKRPDHAEPLRASPQHSFAGKLVRYDVYLQAG